jgi:hypothetical protein
LVTNWGSLSFWQAPKTDTIISTKSNLFFMSVILFNTNIYNL